MPTLSFVIIVFSGSYNRGDKRAAIAHGARLAGHLFLLIFGLVIEKTAGANHFLVAVVRFFGPVYVYVCVLYVYAYMYVYMRLWIYVCMHVCLFA